MACFLVPAAEAVVTTVVKKAADKKAEKTGKEVSNMFIERLGTLNTMLWGGSGLLAFEHIWHGELTPFFPFLTNAADPANAYEMIMEMSTAGVGMAVLVTGVWAAMVAAAKVLEKDLPLTLKDRL